MRTLMFVVVLLLVGIVGVGFYRNWFQVSTHNTDQRPMLQSRWTKTKSTQMSKGSRRRWKTSGKRPRRKSTTGPARPKYRSE